MARKKRFSSELLASLENEIAAISPVPKGFEEIPPGGLEVVGIAPEYIMRCWHLLRIKRRAFDRKVLKLRPIESDFVKKMAGVTSIGTDSIRDYIKDYHSRCVVIAELLEQCEAIEYLMYFRAVGNFGHQKLTRRDGSEGFLLVSGERLLVVSAKGLLSDAKLPDMLVDLPRMFGVKVTREV